MIQRKYCLFLTSIILGSAVSLFADVSAEAREDLNPVTFHPAPSHAPVVLVREGAAVGEIVVSSDLRGQLRPVLADLVSIVESSTGAELPVVAESTGRPALILTIAAEGESGVLPREGFEIRTGADTVRIVGADREGLYWGVYDFLERYVDARFYWPHYSNDFAGIGTSIIENPDLIVPAVHLSDAPAFAKRHRWPSGGPRVGQARMSDHDRRLRSANTWPIDLIVHAPHGWKNYYAEERPEIFQERRDGRRDFDMLCYGHPMTVQTYLEEIEYQLTTQEPISRERLIVRDNAVTVSPADMDIACYSEECQALWDPDGGVYGTASRLMGQFVADLGREVKERWPHLTIIYLPYKNYTYAPEGIEFPDNIEVQLCGMPGLALYKDPTINASEQANIDAWVELTGRRIQNWHYSCWPAHRTDAAYLFPHTIQRHYQENRDKTVGTFINGVKDHWPRQHLSLYVWLKVLWNPDVNVDAIIEEYLHRMYGPASEPMGELVHMLIDGWEKVEWDIPVLSPTTIYEQSYPRADILKMEALLAEAYRKAEGDELVTLRLDYYRPALEAFFAESELVIEGVGIKPLRVFQVAEDPVLDGRLDKEVWQSVESGSFIRANDQEDPQFATEVKAVWSPRGVTFGFRMEEPEMENLAMDIGAETRNASLLWWDDNIEIFIDPSGSRRGYFQVIVNPNGAIYDARERDSSWNAEAIETAAHLGDDYWSLEVFIPYDVFTEEEIEMPGTGVQWHGNFTRHRVGDRSQREYQGFNVTTGNPSHNQNSFGPLPFIER